MDIKNVLYHFAGGMRVHTNYIQKLTELNIGKTAGLSRLKGQACEEFADMRQCMGLTLNTDGTIRQLATYTNVGAPVIKDINIIADFFIGSNKHNACPLILMRNIDTSKQRTAYFMWHLSYSDLMSDRPQEVKTYLPEYFEKVEKAFPNFSIQSIFADPNTDVLVTHRDLLSTDRLAIGSSAQYFRLPPDLNIVSSGLESSIRSYSIAYFPQNDLLLLSGEPYGAKEDHFWVQIDPFSRQNDWIKLSSCAQLIEKIQKDTSGRDLSDLLREELMLKQRNTEPHSQLVQFQTAKRKLRGKAEMLRTMRTANSITKDLPLKRRGKQTQFFQSSVPLKA